MPVEASWEPEYGPKQAIKIVGLADPEEDWMDETYGVICQAKSEGRVIEIPLAECQPRGSGPNAQLLADFTYWFWNYR